MTLIRGWMRVDMNHSQASLPSNDDRAIWNACRAGNIKNINSCLEAIKLFRSHHTKDIWSPLWKCHLQCGRTEVLCSQDHCRELTGNFSQTPSWLVHENSERTTESGNECKLIFNATSSMRRKWTSSFHWGTLLCSSTILSMFWKKQRVVKIMNHRVYVDAPLIWSCRVCPAESRLERLFWPFGLIRLGLVSGRSCCVVLWNQEYLCPGERFLFQMLAECTKAWLLTYMQTPRSSLVFSVLFFSPLSYLQKCCELFFHKLSKCQAHIHEESSSENIRPEFSDEAICVSTIF